MSDASVNVKGVSRAISLAEELYGVAVGLDCLSAAEIELMKRAVKVLKRYKEKMTSKPA